MRHVLVACAASLGLAASAAAANGIPVSTVAIIGDFSEAGDLAIIGDFSLPQGAYTAAAGGHVPLSLRVTLDYMSGGEPVAMTSDVPLASAVLLGQSGFATVRAALGVVDADFLPDGTLGTGQVTVEIMGPEKSGIIGPERGMGVPVGVTGIIGDFSQPGELSIIGDFSLPTGVWKGNASGRVSRALRIRLHYTSGGVAVEKQALIPLADTVLQLPPSHVVDRLGSRVVVRAVIGPGVIGSELPDGGIVGPDNVTVSLERYSVPIGSH